MNSDELRERLRDKDKPLPHTEYSVVRGGVLHLVELPPRFEGKHVKVTISVMESAA